jgi:hypothetical protein
MEAPSVWNQTLHSEGTGTVIAFLSNEQHYGNDSLIETVLTAFERKEHKPKTLIIDVSFNKKLANRLRINNKKYERLSWILPTAAIVFGPPDYNFNSTVSRLENEFSGNVHWLPITSQFTNTISYLLQMIQWVRKYHYYDYILVSAHLYYPYIIQLLTSVSHIFIPCNPSSIGDAITTIFDVNSQVIRLISLGYPITVSGVVPIIDGMITQKSLAGVRQLGEILTKDVLWPIGKNMWRAEIDSNFDDLPVGIGYNIIIERLLEEEFSRPAVFRPENRQRISDIISYSSSSGPDRYDDYIEKMSEKFSRSEESIRHDLRKISIIQPSKMAMCIAIMNAHYVSMMIAYFRRKSKDKKLPAQAVEMIKRLDPSRAIKMKLE